MSYVGNKPAQTTIPVDDSVTSVMIQDDAVTSAKIAGTTIVNADINASAGIALSKLASDPTYDDSGIQDDIAILGFKVAANGSLAKYNLVDQTIDDFQDATGVDASASTGETRNASKYYSGASAVTKITNATALGNMTSTGGGIAAAFDGVRIKSSWTTSARKDPSTGAFVGQDWGSGNDKTVTKFMLWAPGDYTLAGTTADKYYKLQGSTDNFSSSIVDLYTDAATSISNNATYDVTSGITITTAYRYHRILFEGDGNGGAVAQLEFYEGGTAQDMTLISTTTTAQAAPTKGDIVFTYTNGAGTTTLGTDLTAEFSADGGSTWTSMTLGSEGTTGGHNIATAHDVTLTSTSGTSMAYRIKTLNQSASKTTRIQAVSLGWS